MIFIDNLDLGGAQKLIQLQAQEMHNKHYQVRVVNLGFPSDLQREMGAAGIDVVDIGLRHLRDLAGLKRLADVVRGWSPHVIHAHLIHSVLLGAAFCKTGGARLVCTIHNEVPNSGAGIAVRVKVALEGWIFRRVAAQVIGCGPRVVQGQRGRLGGRSVTTLVNRVSPAAKLSDNDRLRIRQEWRCDNEVLFLAAGRLTRQKGFDLLIRAYKHASASLPSSRLVIIGEGEQHEDLRHLIASQDLVDRVVLAGPRSDARLLLGVGDVFVMSSRWEGLPLVLLEAMAAGLPVISTNVGDVSTVTGRSSALLVEPEDVEGLAAAMSEMGMDADLRRQLSAASLASVEPYTDLEAFVTELEDVYLRALAKEN